MGRLTFIFHPGDQILMGGDGVNAPPLAKVPNFAGVVSTAGSDVVPTSGGRRRRKSETGPYT